MALARALHLLGLLLAVTAPGLSLAAAASHGTRSQEATSNAPDGRPGFGTRAPGEVLKLVRQPAREDEAWMAALDALPTELAQRASLAESLYRSRGWFGLCGDQPGQTLVDLLASYRHLQLDPIATLQPLDARARAFAAAWTDMRFRARAGLLEEASTEARDLALALGLLRGAARSWGALSDDETMRLARRADLAAARLRAIRLDLDALREPPNAFVASPEVDACLAIARDSDAVRRLARFSELSAWLTRREQAFTGSMFTTRLSEQAVAALAWRKAALVQAGAAREAAREFSPDIDAALARDPKITQLRTTDRRRLAQARALEALAQDPLDETATWIGFVSTRHVGAAPQALALAYRYLRLRGIVFEDGANKGRDRLSDEEEQAEFYVREVLAGVYGPFPGLSAR
ncbi:MAG: hypothetical protein FJ299_13420 [Planctomycetes bacterium]|nr:hypothetical protein [Planctomycetota bacterium]